MSEQERQETEPTEPPTEPAPEREVKRDEAKKRTTDTLTEDNPLICRGTD